MLKAPPDRRPTPRDGILRYFFVEYAFDTDRRELHRGPDLVCIAPQVFDLLDYLIRNRERVVSRDDLIKAVWNGRIVSDAALTTRLNVARTAIGDANSVSSRHCRARAFVSLRQCWKSRGPRPPMMPWNRRSRNSRCPITLRLPFFPSPI
jgi:hypothetical protein